MKERIKAILSISLFKKTLHAVAAFYLATLGAFLFRLAKRYAYYHTQLMFATDWLLSDKTPSNFKHEINLYSWRFKPTEVEFAEAAFGRMHLKRGDVVLDLCCGDGSYAYLFFSDLAERIDSVDYDEITIAYAKKNFGTQNINFKCANLLVYPFPEFTYDLVIWTSGVAYFSKENRAKILNGIYRSLKKGGKLYIKTPIEENFLTSANQISVITDKEDFQKELSMFTLVNAQQSYYSKRSNLNYILSKPE